jgi:hypothetical protein
MTALARGQTFRGQSPFMPLPRRSGGAPLQHAWELVETSPEYSDLVGRRFQNLDVIYGFWPRGSRFRHVISGKTFVVRGATTK